MTTKTIKFKKLKTDFVKSIYPVLYNTVEDLFDDLNKEQVYGLMLEIALQSKGTTDMFEDELSDELFDDEEEAKW